MQLFLFLKWPVIRPYYFFDKICFLSLATFLSKIFTVSSLSLPFWKDITICFSFLGGMFSENEIIKDCTSMRFDNKILFRQAWYRIIPRQLFWEFYDSHFKQFFLCRWKDTSFPQQSGLFSYFCISLLLLDMLIGHGGLWRCGNSFLCVGWCLLQGCQLLLSPGSS